MTDRLAGRSVHFDRADQPPRIVGVNGRSRHGIDLLEALMKRLGADLLDFAFNLPPQFPVRRRAVEQPSQERLEI